MKIIIIDDEILFREALKVTVDFQELGLEVVGEGKNGTEAVALLEEWEPEIALIDINMPVMDGLEFAKYVDEHGYKTKIIIISGYDHFDFAKQALQSGVYSYLLKPVDEEELRNELADLITTIEIETSMTQELNELRNLAAQNKPYLKERYILDFLLGFHKVEDKQYKEKCLYFDIHFPEEAYSVIVIEVDGEKSTEEELELIRLQLKKLVAKRYDSVTHYEWTFDQFRRLCIILDQKVALDQNRLAAHFGSIVKTLGLDGFHLRIGVSNTYSGLLSIENAYKEALLGLNHALQHNQTYCFYGSISLERLTDNLISRNFYRDILVNLRSLNYEQVTNNIDQLFDRIEEKQPHPYQLIYLCTELISVCFEVYGELEKESDYDLVWISTLFDDKIYHKPLSEIKNWVLELYLKVISDLSNVRSRSSKELVNKIKSYVDRHYNETSFSIDQISKTIYVNYSHLCYVFKKETDMTINEYLIDKRINQSIELMNQGYTVVSKIADKVGFSDAGYFSKSFKKYMGITPSKYINQKNT